MSPVLLLLLGIAIFAFGYLFYSKFLSKRIYRLDSRFTTPAHELRDSSSGATTSPPWPEPLPSWDLPSQ